MPKERAFSDVSSVPEAALPNGQQYAGQRLSEITMGEDSDVMVAPQKPLFTWKRLVFMVGLFTLGVSFFYDQANDNVFFATIASVANYLCTCPLWVALIIIALLGLLSPPIGAPYFPFPLLCGYSFYYRTRSHIWSIIITSILTGFFSTISALMIFWMSHHILKEVSE